MERKEKNDAIEEAFIKRKEASGFFKREESPEVKLRILGTGMKHVISKNPSLKKSLLKMLISSARLKNSNTIKSSKVILVWFIGWLSKLFNLLSRPVHQ